MIDDDPEFGSVLENMLAFEGNHIELATSGADGLRRVGHGFDAILLDLFLDAESGLDVLRALKDRSPFTPVIMMTGNGSLDTVAEALRLGAFDFVTKPFGRRAIVEVLERAIDMSAIPAGGEGREAPVFPTLVGRSAAMIEMFKVIAKAAATDATILISGESGTGKELVARAVHDNSRRVRQPFVAINCGALTETLLESELFGHVRGAFTGAQSRNPGVFRSASGGTVFLDEVTETSPAFQVKLLRVLQERKVRPVGSSEEALVDVRVIAATNRPIESLRTQEQFRADLLYRLSVINIRVPALRERGGDIPDLATYFLHKFARQQNKQIVFAPGALEWLRSRAWEGNVRELENAVERAVAMCSGGVIAERDFETRLSAPASADEADGADSAAELSLEEVTRAHILRVLRHTGGNKLRAAEILGVGRWSLYRMAKRLGIDIDNV